MSDDGAKFQDGDLVKPKGPGSAMGWVTEVLDDHHVRVRWFRVGLGGGNPDDPESSGPNDIEAHALRAGSGVWPKSALEKWPVETNHFGWCVFYLIIVAIIAVAAWG